ncbi:MAG: DUF2309 family protein [Bacteroidetes bacterium]|nr:DUF2309 family protein [Bacteroidota bacterium]
MQSDNHAFDEAHVLHDLKHYLPAQTPLKDFIHHNSLHAFQDQKFYEGIFKASKAFGFQVTLQLSDYRRLYEIGRIKPAVLEKVIIEKKGIENLEPWREKALRQGYDENNDPRIGYLRARWKDYYKIDLDTLVHPLLFRILCSYLDQGVAIQEFPSTPMGFLKAMIDLEQHSFTSFFKTARAKKLLLAENHSISDLLDIVVGDPKYYAQYLFDQQFSHRGWSGMAAILGERPDSNMNVKRINLDELIIFELLMEIDALDYKFGQGWQPLAHHFNEPPVDILAEVPRTELQEIFMIWQDAFEWSYYDEALSGIEQLKQRQKSGDNAKSFQAIFCIDERECSLRRHVEAADKQCETLGMPGFFGVEFFFQPENAKFYDKLCPAPVTPKFLIKEYDVQDERAHDLMYTSTSHTLWGGYLASFTFGFWALLRLFANIFRPKMSPAISNAFAHMHKHSKLTVENKNPEDRENGLQVGFTIDEMTVRVESVLRGIGLIRDFAPIVYFVAHGSSSANNPHHGAHDCGACSGRPGSVNARVITIMCNHPAVRANLRTRGIDIPDTTQFVGGLHDTASDLIDFFDEDILTPLNASAHESHLKSFEIALNNNAKERSRRFASINTRLSLEAVREEIRKRSVSLFEPRPELGHGTNSLCIVGRRSLTKGLFFDRRAFLNSYDPTTDPEGKLLLGIMRPVAPVCGGINLEYYFSRVDNYKLGAGTKLPHNVMGLIGVANSSDGDLRPGLPLQMIEVHDPIRLLVIVEHRPEIVLKTIQSSPDMYEWYVNEWVHIVAANPDDNQFYYFKNGSFQRYETVIKHVPIVDNTLHLIESAKEMETNHIVDATQENLPIYIIES